mmetsp:Transcript_4409/g.5115  ORF Transcript_4409/g.5115 Transcript_4409/m.5115 type:complete len:536 (+) Transcript_4409:150-1757(+)
MDKRSPSSFWDHGLKETTKDQEAELFNPYDRASFAEVFGETEALSSEVINEKAGTPPLQISANEEEQKLELLRDSISSRVPSYRVPIEKSEEKELLGDERGQIWYAKIVDNDFTHPKLVLKDGSLKPRNPLPHIFRDEFFDQVSLSKDGKWVFTGCLNDWPALTNLEVIQLEYWYSKKVGGQNLTFSKRFWKKGESAEKPYYPEAGQDFFLIEPTAIRATLKAPAWSHIGFSENNPGFVFWYAAFREGGPRMSHGENIVEAARSDALAAGKFPPNAVAAHFFGHRYAKAKESPRDLLTYHTGVLLEWDHGKFTTVVELAYQYGMGGYGGKSNWIEDRDAKPMPGLFAAMPGDLKAPWKTNRHEIRLIDHPAKNLREFEAFMKKYEGPKGRFIDPQIKYSGDVKISMRSQDAIMQFIVNYSVRDITYSEEFHNCQSFASDFFRFLCDTEAEPYHPVKILYTPRTDLFLYAHENYEDNMGLKWIDIQKLKERTESMRNFVQENSPDMRNYVKESAEGLNNLFQKGLKALTSGNIRWS